MPRVVCRVCCFEFSKRKRKPIACPACGVEICARCVARLPGDPNACVFCHAEWPLDMLEAEMGSALGRARIERAGASEMEFLPATVPFVELRNEYDALKKRAPDIQLERDCLKKRVKALDVELSRSKSFSSFLKGSEEAQEVYNSATSSVKAQPCPRHDCEGYLYSKTDSKTARCTACEALFCTRCSGEVLGGEGHACDESVLLSLVEIERATKPCPSCRAPIERAEGCNAMWCVACDTAFDWSTGKKIKLTDSFHNPHYHEAINRQRDALRDAYARVPYGVEATGSDPLNAKHLVRMASAFVASTSSELPPRGGPLRDNGEDAFFRSIDLRVRLLQNLISEEAFKRMAGARAMRRHYPDRAKSLARELALHACGVLLKLHASRSCPKRLHVESDAAVRDLEEMRSAFNGKLANAAAACGGSCEPFVVTPQWKLHRRGSEPEWD